MNDNFTNTELLIRFLDGELMGTDLSDLEKKLAEDKLLREELHNLRMARDAIRSYGLNKHVNAIRNEMKPGLQQNKRPGVIRVLARNSLKIAATVIILFLTIGIYHYATLSPTDLFAENYAPYTIRETRDTQGKSSIEDAFRQSQFSLVITVFKNLKEPTLNEYFLAGNAYLHENKTSDAIQSFSTILQKNQQSGTHDLEDDAEYYLGMSYLKNKQVDKALPIFEKIHLDKEHSYHDKVSTWFLRKLNWTKS